MAVEISELKIGTRSLSKKKHERSYRIANALTEEIALAELLFWTPTVFNDRTRDDDSVKVEEVASNLYVGTVTWTSQKKEDEPGDCSFSFDISGAMSHITHSIATVNSYPAEAPDFENAIGVDKNGAQGADIFVPYFAIHFSKVYEDIDITPAYRQAIRDVVDKTNDAAFTIDGETFEVRELLFIGASRTKSKEEETEITFRFLYSKNETDLVIGTITDIEKKGWEYLWTLNETQEDTSAMKLVERPIAVYVEQVYQDADFSVLGLCPGLLTKSGKVNDLVSS